MSEKTSSTGLDLEVMASNPLEVKCGSGNTSGYSSEGEEGEVKKSEVKEKRAVSYDDDFPELPSFSRDQKQGHLSAIFPEVKTEPTKVTGVWARVVEGKKDEKKDDASREKALSVCSDEGYKSPMLTNESKNKETNDIESVIESENLVIESKDEIEDDKCEEEVKAGPTEDATEAKEEQVEAVIIKEDEILSEIDSIESLSDEDLEIELELEVSEDGDDSEDKAPEMPAFYHEKATNANGEISSDSEDESAGESSDELSFACDYTDDDLEPASVIEDMSTLTSHSDYVIRWRLAKVANILRNLPEVETSDSGDTQVALFELPATFLIANMSVPPPGYCRDGTKSSTIAAKDFLAGKLITDDDSDAGPEQQTHGAQGVIFINTALPPPGYFEDGTNKPCSNEEEDCQHNEIQAQSKSFIGSTLPSPGYCDEATSNLEESSDSEPVLDIMASASDTNNVDGMEPQDEDEPETDEQAANLFAPPQTYRADGSKKSFAEMCYDREMAHKSRVAEEGRVTANYWMPGMHPVVWVAEGPGAEGTVKKAKKKKKNKKNKKRVRGLKKKHKTCASYAPWAMWYYY